MNLFEKFGCGNFAAPLALYAPRWGITDPEDQARLLGQLSVESEHFTRTVENLSYKPARLLEVFRGRNGLETLDQAATICAGGYERIAAAIYGMPWGSHLGNTSNEDAVKFIGRGLIQLTGRQNYHDASYGCFGDERLLDAPTLLQQPDSAANVACWFWYSRKLSGLNSLTTITLKVNGALSALAERTAETQRALSLIGQG